MGNTIKLSVPCCVLNPPEEAPDSLSPWNTSSFLLPVYLTVNTRMGIQKHHRVTVLYTWLFALYCSSQTQSLLV